MVNWQRFLVVKVVLICTSSCLFAGGATNRASKKTREQLLIEAAYKVDVKKVKAMLAQDAKVNAEYGNQDLHAFFDPWDSGFSPNGHEHWTALLALAHSNRLPPPPRTIGAHEEDIRLDYEKRIPLDHVKQRDKERIEIAKMLFANGASLGKNPKGSSSCLYVSIERKHPGLSNFLIEKAIELKKGANAFLNSKAPNGEAPIHRAVFIPNVLKKLIKAKADINIQDAEGNTALHWCAYFKQPEAAKILVTAGARRDLLNAEKEKAIDILSEPRSELEQSVYNELIDPDLTSE